MPPAAAYAAYALLRHRALLYAFCRGAQSGSSFSLSLLSFVRRRGGGGAVDGGPAGGAVVRGEIHSVWTVVGTPVCQEC